MRHYLDKLLEEVDEAQAGALRAAEGDIAQREGSLKSMRAEVVKWWLREGRAYLIDCRVWYRWSGSAAPRMRYSGRCGSWP